MRFRLILLATALAGSISAGICRAENMAVVNGVAITREAFTKGLENGIGLSENFQAGRRVLDALIGMQVIKEELKARGLTISEEELQVTLVALKKSIAASGGSFEEFLKQTGASEADILPQLELDLALRKLAVSDAEVEQYLKANAKPTDVLEQRVKYYSMAFMTKEAAEAASKEAREGKKDFATIAQERGAIKTSVPPTQLLTATTGPAPFKMEGITSPDPNFLKQLFAAPAGQVSEPLSIKLGVPLETTATTAEGKTETKKLGSAQREFWIVAKVIAHEAEYSQDDKNNAREKLFQQKASSGEVARYVNGLKVKAKITIPEARYKSLVEDYQRLATAPPPPPLIAAPAPAPAAAPAAKTDAPAVAPAK
jgi:hypothetical protein